MIVVERSHVIAAGPFEIWNRIADPDALPRWLAPVRHVEVLEGTGVGRRQRHVGEWRGKRSEVDVVVTAFDPGARLSWRHENERLGGPAPRWSAATCLTITLSRAARGTRVTLRSEQEPASRVKGLLVRLFAGRTIGTALERSLVALDRLVRQESDPNP